MKEVDINYDAYAEDTFIPANWIQAAVNLNYPQMNQGVGYAGFDIAAGGADESCYIIRKHRQFFKSHIMRTVETPLQGARKVGEESKKFGVSVINYDENAYGEDIGNEMLKEYPLAGSVFRVSPGVKGVNADFFGD